MTIFDIAPLSEWRFFYKFLVIAYSDSTSKDFVRLSLANTLLDLRLAAAQKRIRELERELGHNADK